MCVVLERKILYDDDAGTYLTFVKREMMISWVFGARLSRLIWPECTVCCLLKAPTNWIKWGEFLPSLDISPLSIYITHALTHKLTCVCVCVRPKRASRSAGTLSIYATLLLSLKFIHMAPITHEPIKNSRLFSSLSIPYVLDRYVVTPELLFHWFLTGTLFHHLTVNEWETYLATLVRVSSFRLASSSWY